MPHLGADEGPNYAGVTGCVQKDRIDADDAVVARPDSMWRRVACVWSLAGLLVTVVAGLASFLPFLPPVPGPIVVVCFVGLFPTFGAAVIAGAVKTRMQKPKLFTRGTWPWPVPTWLGVVMIFGLVSFLSAMAQLPGQPEAHDGSYCFNDHGTCIPTDRAGYERGLRAQNRIFTGIPAIFYGVALTAWRRDPDDQ